MSAVFEELLRVRDLEAGFLYPKYEETLDPDLLPDMQVAVSRLKQAKERQEKVLIYGDYDVDGVTASTLMNETLTLAGIEVAEIMLPNRFLDGYGMSKKVVQKAAETGAKLVITVDCGSRNHEIIAELKEKRIDTIVTDHHECGDDLPGAIAVVNPKRRYWPLEDYFPAEPGQNHGLSAARDSILRGSPNPKEVDVAVQGQLRDLAGVGVAFKLAQALTKAGMIPDGQEKWLLDLVLIGTICDSMVLRGENRRLCYFGLMVLGKTRRAGLKELMRTAGVQKLDSEAIGFQIGPRLNAAGRMETAGKALDLLLAKQKTIAATLALELEELNAARKSQQLAALNSIREQGIGERPVIVVKGDWHEGVLGIIAGRLVEEYHRPAFVLAELDGVLKGSGRSFGDFNLAEALAVCDKYLLSGGGHAGACGLKLETEQLDGFVEAVNQYYTSLNLKDQERFLGVNEDLVVEEFEELSLELIEELRKLEPYGEGNPEPVFLLPEVRVVEAAKLGSEGRHLRLTVWDKQGKSMKLIRFYAPEEDLRIRGGETVNAWITLAENEFRGLRSVEGRILKLAVA